MGLCIPALALGIGRPSGLERFAALSMLALTGIACFFAYSGGGLTRREGAAIIGLYAVFVVVIVATAA